MKKETWWDYFDEEPYEKVSRQVEGMFGEKITITLDRLDWAYLDWIEENLNANITKFIQTLERQRLPSDGERDQIFADNVRKNFLTFEKKGRPRPPWCDPAHPDDFDELEHIEIRDW